MHAIQANGASIPALGFGTWTLSGERAAQLVKSAILRGWRHIDTAAMYGNEEEVGQGIRASGIPRDELFVTTKVWHTDLAPGDLRRSAEQSLGRLGLEEVDLLLIHWPNPQVPLADTIGALNRVREDGLARHIGVSNFPRAMFADAVRLSDAPIVVNQVEHHPYLDQSALREVVRASGAALVGYCPLFRGGGLFAEPAIIEAAHAHSRTPAQVVLRWHVQQDGVAAIPRTSNPARLDENLDVFDFVLDDEQMAAITALGSRAERLCDYAFSPRWE